MESIMFEHLPASTRILRVSGAGIALTAALATSQPFFDKADVASSGAAPAERVLPAEPAGVAGPQDVAKVAEQVKPAVIAVISHAIENAVVAPPLPGQDRQKHPYRFGISQGSGFLITADGYAVTNDHVVNGSAAAEIKLDDGKTYKARVVATDPTSDLALLKIDGRNDFPHVKFADKAPDVGDRIISVGNPFGLGGTVTAGIVSALGRDVSKSSASKAPYEDMIQIDAPINRGNSGGPTFDLAGNVIGVNSIIFSPTGGSIGIGFAIPSEKVKSVIAQLKEKGSVTRGWLAMQLQSVTAEIADTLELTEPSGILVTEVEPQGGAAEAGLKTGDLIKSIDGETVRDSHQFNRVLDGTPPRAVVLLGIVRDGQDRSIIAPVASKPVSANAPPPEVTADEGVIKGREKQLGLQLAPAGTSGGEDHGARVVAVDPLGLAAGGGIDPGDVILDISNQEIRVPDDVYRLIADAQRAGKRSILMRIQSGGSTQFIALALG
jgi:serine protease Do